MSRKHYPAEKYLKRIRAYDLKVSSINDEITNIRAIAEKCTPTLSLTPGGGGDSDKLGIYIVKKEKLETELNKALAEALDYKSKVFAIINKIQDINKQTILIDYYFSYKTLGQLEQKYRINYWDISRLHTGALVEFEKIHKQTQIEL